MRLVRRLSLRAEGGYSLPIRDIRVSDAPCPPEATRLVAGPALTT